MTIRPLYFLLLFSLLFINKQAQSQTTTAKIAVGAYQSLVLKEDGSVYVFGSGSNGVLGLGMDKRLDIPNALDVPALVGKTIVDAEFDARGAVGAVGAGIILTNDGKLYGWGDNSSRQFGPSGTNPSSPLPFLMQDASLDTAFFVGFAKEEGFSFVLTDKGTLFAMGSNDNGYLGLDTSASPIVVPTVVPIPSGSGKVVKISASLVHRLVLTDSNKLYGFGENTSGELGDSTRLVKLTPVEISTAFLNGKVIKDILAIQYNSYLLTTDGTVYSWGRFSGPLGNGIFTKDVLTPTQITHPSLEGKSIASISGNRNSSYNGVILVATDGSVYVVGDNTNGHLGADELVKNDTSWTKIPAASFQGKAIVEASVGGNFSLFRASDGTLFGTGTSAGTGYSGRFGKPLPINTSYLAGKTISKMRIGVNVALLIDTDGKGYFWDSQAYPTNMFSTNIRGRDRKDIKDVPTLLTHSNLDGHTIVDVKAGGRNSYLLTSQGKVFSFGFGANGTLGLGDSLDVYVPTLISHANLTGKKIIDIAATWDRNSNSTSNSHALLLADDGSLFSMGSNNVGQLGLGDFTNRFVPTPVTTNLNGKTIVKIAVNAQNSMAIASDGTVFLWGAGGAGEMGFGNTTILTVPTLATHLSGKTIIDGAIGVQSYGNNPHFVVLTDDNKLFSFGNNFYGQLGQGNNTVDPVVNNIPTAVLDSQLSGENVVSVLAGSFIATSMLLTNKGHVFSWGRLYVAGFDVAAFFSKHEPTLVTSTDIDGRRVLATAYNFTHSLALLDDGRILSFGDSRTLSYGHMGAGHIGDGESGFDYISRKVPTLIPNFTTRSTPIPSTNLVVHLDADRGAIIAGDTLKTWSDLSGLSHNAAETGSKRPLVVDSAFGIHRGIRFDGATKYLTLPTSTDLGIQSHDYEVFIVAKTATSNSTIAFLLAGNSLEQFELHLNGSAGARFIPKTGLYVDKGSAGSFTDGAAQLFNVSASSTESRMAVNRSQTTSLIDGQSSSATALRLGIRGDNSFPFVGDIAEVIIYSEVLSPEDRRKVETYLSDKYQIALPDEKSVSITGNEGWRLLASPAKDSTYGSFFRSIWTQGITGADYESGTPNIYTWPKTSIGRDSVEWIPLSSMNVTYPIGQGSLVYVFSDDNGSGGEGDAGFPKTFSTDGIISPGDQNLSSLLNTNTNGWTLLGNPYTDAIDWDLFSRKNVNNAVYVWNPSSSEWKSWNGSIGGLTDGKIGAINGFFVQTNATDPSLTIPSSAKVSGESFLGKKSAENITAFNITLSNSKGLKNQAWIQFAEDANTGLDSKDALKLAPFSNDYVQIGTVLANGKVLDINYLPNSLSTIDIPLEIKSSQNGNHTISLDRSQFPESWTVKLFDEEAGIETDLSETYTFNWTSAPAKQVVINSENKPSVSVQSSSSSRFSLRIGGITTGVEEVKNIVYEFVLNQNYPNPFNPSTTISFSLPNAQKVSLEVFDITGRRVATLLNENQAAGNHEIMFNASRLSSGMYFYRLSSNTGTITKKLVLIK